MKEFGEILRFMDKEEEILFPGVLPENTEAHHNRLVIEGFLEGNPGRIFTISEMRRELPFPISRETCLKILHEVDLVLKLNKRHKEGKYKSLAPPLPENDCYLQDNDLLREQARNDFYKLVKTRSRNLKNGFQIIHKF